MSRRIRGRARASRRARWGRYLRAVRWPLLAYLPAAVAFARARRKLGAPWPVSLLAAGVAPLVTGTALPRGRFRYAAIWATQMWSYKVAFEIPYDEPNKLYRRLRVDYPIRIDSAIGAGLPPGERLQRRLRRPPRLSWLDRLAGIFYFTWELEPHAAMLWLLLRHPARFVGSAGRLAATFDLTLLGYFANPTAPPWWASEREGRMDRSVRRVVAEVGKELLGKPRPGVDHNAGSNPWAAMPSDHFASAVMTAMVLSDADRQLGTLACAYALVLGAVLVYTGEHYVTDLIAGLLLTLTVRFGAPFAAGVASDAARVFARFAPDPR